MGIKVKILRELFKYTQSKQAKVIGAWVIIPWCIAMASKDMWKLAVATSEVIQGMTFLESFPYVVACATVFAVTGCFKIISIQLRRKHPLPKLLSRSELSNW